MNLKFYDNDPVWQKRNVARFSFTQAMPDGAWLETIAFPSSDGPRAARNWFSIPYIDRILGRGSFQRLCSRQGWMTGTWVAVGEEQAQ